MAGGRPTKKSDAVVKKLEEAAALDCTIDEMCFYAGISKPTYYQYIKDDPKLFARLEALRNEPVLSARQSVIRAMKIDPDLALKYLERKRKGEFSERKEHTAAGGAPLFQFDDETKAKVREAWGQLD